MSSKKALVLLGAAVLAGGAAIAAKEADKTRKRIKQSYGRWHTITVNRSTNDFKLDGTEFKPLNDLGDAIVIRVTPAPSGRGTEISARLSNDQAEDGNAKQTLGKLRQALRDTQSLLETGEVLKADKPSSTHKTLTGLPLDYVTRRAKEGGLL